MHEKGTNEKISDQRLVNLFMDCKEVIGGKKSFSIFDSTAAILPESFCRQAADQESFCDGAGNSEKYSLALVPVKVSDADWKPGWPLLHSKISLPNRKSSERSSFHRISVVQWAMQLPSRDLYYAANDNKDQILGLDSKSGALVPVDTEIGIVASPEHESRSIPKELEGLHEKYSSTCRLFMYQELVSATSNFLPGVYFDYDL